MAALTCKRSIALTASQKHCFVSFAFLRVGHLKYSASCNKHAFTIKSHRHIVPESSLSPTALSNQRSFYASTIFNAANSIKTTPFSTSSVSNQIETDAEETTRGTTYTEDKNHEVSNEGGSAISDSLHRLNLNIQRTGRAYIRTVEAIFSAVKGRGECTSNEALLLLRCCGTILTDEKPSVRADLSESIWNFLQNSDIKLDTSHYNALLKNRLDNESPDFKPSEFLANMEKHGIEANRVTFQHMIAKFCSLGDIQGATTILEHMKEQRLPINENVFHSLIVGHARAGDFEEAKKVMTIMVESGVDVDIDTRMVFVLELAKAGEDYQKELDNIKEQGLTLTDHEYFKLIVLLLKKGNKNEAANIASTLPKKRGFFQEMRNFIPAMISSGELELPFKILEEFSFPTSLGSEGHPDSNKEDHGLFFLQSMIKNEYDPKSLIEYAKKFQASQSIVSNRILEFCLEHGNIKYAQSIYDEIIAQFGQNSIEARNSSSFVRSRANSLQMQGSNPSDVSAATVDFLLNMGVVGLRPLASDISQSLMPNLMLGKIPGLVMKDIHEKTRDLLDKGIKLRNPLPYSSLSNSMIMYLLNKEEKFAFGQAITFITSLKVPTKPHLWNTGLARSFLATDSRESLVSMLALCSSAIKKYNNKEQDKPELFAKNDEDIFLTLNQIIALAPRYLPDCEPTEILIPILRDLREIKIGVPESITSMIQRNLKEHDPEFESLLQQLKEIYNDNTYWTKERAIDLINQRKQYANTTIGSVRPDYIDIDRNGQIRPEQIPTDIQGLERVQRLLEKKKKYNMTVIHSLIMKYIENEKMEKADDLINRYIYGNNFYVNVQLISKYVDGCIETSQLEKAEEMMKYAASKSYHINLKSYVNLGKAMADQGKHADVLEMFQSINITCVKQRGLGDIEDLMQHYITNFGDDHAMNIFQALQDSKLISMGKKYESFKGRRKQVSEGFSNIQEEIENFENIAREQQKLFHPITLLKKLALKEDTEGIQRVLDASISVIGEERSVYNLAVSFIETGKLTQAKKLLATPGLRYDRGKLTHIINKYINHGLLNELEHLVLFSKPIFACDREFMYSRLIFAYVKEKKYHGIQEAWVNIQEEDFGPSDRLKIQIAKGLQAGDLPVPFSIPDEKLIHRPQNENSVDIENIENKEFTTENLSDAINGKDAKKVIDIAKERSSKKSLTTHQGTMILDFVRDIEDIQLGFEIVKSIFDDPHTRNAFRGSTYRNELILAMQKFDRTQLESILETIPKEYNERLLRWVFGRIASLHVDEDVEGFLSTLGTMGTHHNSNQLIPNHNWLQKVIEKGHNEKLRDICLDLQDTNPRMSLETIKACLVMNQHLDLVNRLWEKLEDKELALPTFWIENLRSCDIEELERVKDFFISRLSNLSLHETTKTSLQDSVIELYNQMIYVTLKETSKDESQNNSDRAVKVLEGALRNWITLDR